MEGFFRQLQTRAKSAKELVETVAFEAKVEWDDFVSTGLGVPGAVSDAVGLGCFAIAAAGTASVSFDLFRKVYGTRECKRCNGWEGLTCRTCRGIGKVHFLVKNPNLKASEKNSAANVAAAVLDGRADVAHIPAGLSMGAGLPTKHCPTCDGSGVMKCPLCKGDAWKNKVSFDRIFDVSWKAWDVYRLSTPVRAPVPSVQNPDLAKFFMFVQPELEHGVQIPEDTKKRMWWQYEHAQQYERLHAEVARREPGWEDKQKALVNLNPRRAMEDPVMVPNPSFFKAVQQTEEEVSRLTIPPRPTEWKGPEVPDLLAVPDWSQVRDPQQKAEWEEALQKQQTVKAGILDKAWAQQWRQAKVAEMLQKKAASLQPEEGPSAPAPVPPRPAGDKAEVAQEKTKTVAAARKDKAAERKKVDKKAEEEERKKKEKEEKRARLAKQAAEREAALAAARKGKGQAS